MRSWLLYIPAGLVDPHMKYQLATINRSWDSILHWTKILPWSRGRRTYIRTYSQSELSMPLAGRGRGAIKISFGTKRLMKLKLGIRHRVPKYYQICSNDTGLISTIFMTWSNLFLMLLYGWKLIQHTVMHFQACYNSAYPMRSFEQYRTNGSLVLRMALFIILASAC